MTGQFRGVFSVSITPFDAAGAVDVPALRRHLCWLLAAGVHGLIPAGSTGEFAFLSEAERDQVVRIAVEEAAGQVPVIAGAAGLATADTIRYAQAAQAAGAQGVMVVPPFYGRLSQAELYAHFAELADALDVPVMLYNNPGASGSDLLPETVARLAEHPRIAAIKESTGIMQRVTEIRRLCGEQIEVLCGCDTLPLEMFQMGVAGWVAAPSNIVPRECVRLFALAVEQNDQPAARALYERLLPLFSLFEDSGQYVQLNKAGLAILGRPAGNPRPPLLPPNEASSARLAELLAAIGAQA